MREIRVDHIIQAVFSQGLLLGADSHLEHMLDRVNPIAVVFDEGIVFHRIPGAFDVDVLQRMGWQPIVDNILRRDSEKPGLGDAEEFVEVRGPF